jgi:hypothetical protein
MPKKFLSKAQERLAFGNPKALGMTLKEVKQVAKKTNYKKLPNYKVV